MTGNSSVRWYASFYWRIGLSFLVLVIVVLVAQSAMFNYIVTRNPPFRGRSPNNLSAIVAADLASTLTQDPTVDLQEYLTREYGRTQPIYAVMKDGRLAANTSKSLANDLRRSAEAMLAGTDFKRTGSEPQLGRPPVVTAPIQVANQLWGMVVLPPRAEGSPIVRDVSRMLSLPGTLLLILATAVAALVIFEPARRRLKLLERASERLGAGDLTVRAPEGGGDEIAHVAAAFNRMATELSRRDEALRTSDRLRRQMLADVSHELKTPLTAMRGYVETLHMADVSLDLRTRDRYFETVERETLRLDRIVRDLLDLARLENGVGDLDIRVFAIRRVFDHVAQRHEHDAAIQQTRLRTSVGAGADQIVADPDRIEQVVENLVANALRHTVEGTIEMCAAAEGKSIVLSVTDSGKGIRPEHIAHVFDRFYKVDEARANGSGGSGLGLSIAKAIVERHGGTIDVTSRPGRTVFTIRLPQDDVVAAPPFHPGRTH
jgi:signal transduction histidine kinase